VIGNHTKENDQGLLLYLGVHPDARGKNVGAKLAEQLVKLLENSQSREIFLTVHPNNAIAIKLYKKARFEVTATYDNYYLDDEPRVLITEQTV
jgi:ribosomal-protein-alanine N-acetyltransferase